MFYKGRREGSLREEGVLINEKPNREVEEIGNHCAGTTKMAELPKLST